MTEAQDQKITAQRLLDKIQSSLNDTLTPKQAHSLMLLKGMNVSDLAGKAIVPELTLEGWLKGESPILPARKLSLVELVLGVERSAFTHDRIHLLNFDESRTSKDKLCAMLDDVLPFMSGGVRNQVCDADGNDRWHAGAKIFAVQLPQGQNMIIRHLVKGSFISNPVAAGLETLRWASHGSQLDNDHSELVVPEYLANELHKKAPLEGDVMSSHIIENLIAAQKIKQHGSLRAITGKLGGP